MVPSSLPLQAFSVACAPYLNLVNNLMQDNQETTSDTSKQPILYKFVCFSLLIFSVLTNVTSFLTLTVLWIKTDSIVND